MKKVPLRKCVATGEQLPKKELIRIVRNKEGEVSVDPTGKKNGRGAYLKRSLEGSLFIRACDACKKACDWRECIKGCPVTAGSSCDYSK